MFLPLSAYIGIKYLQSKKRYYFVSLTTAISMIGIALSVAVLITVLSIMNGFDEVVSSKIFDISHHITIQDMERSNHTQEWSRLRHQLLQNSHIQGVAPFLVSQGLLIHSTDTQPAVIYGILPSLEESVSTVSNKITSGVLHYTHNNLKLC